MEQKSSDKNVYSRWAARLIHLYPSSWRERYAEEMFAILEEQPPTLKTIFDLVLNVCDAHIHHHFVQGRMPDMLKRLYGSVITIFCACLLFCIGLFFSQTRLPGASMMNDIESLVSGTGPLMAGEPILSLIIKNIGYALFFFLVLGGIPLIISCCWNALKNKRYRIVFLCLLGSFGPFVLGYIFLRPWNITFYIYRIAGRSVGDWILITLFRPWYIISSYHIAGRSVGDWILIGIFCTAIRALGIAFRQSPPDARLAKFSLFPATVVSILMIAYMVALLIWVVPAIPATLTLGSGRAYLVREFLFIMLMSGAIILSVVSLLRGYRSHRALSFETV